MILIYSTKRTKICVHRFAYVASITVAAEDLDVATYLPLSGNHFQEK